MSNQLGDDRPNPLPAGNPLLPSQGLNSDKQRHIDADKTTAQESAQAAQESTQQSAASKDSQVSAYHLAVTSELIGRLQSHEAIGHAANELACSLADLFKRFQCTVCVALLDPKGKMRIDGCSDSRLLQQRDFVGRAISASLEAMLCEEDVRCNLQRPSNSAGTLCLQQLAQHLRCHYLYATVMRDTQRKISGVFILASEAQLKPELELFLQAASTPISDTFKLLRRVETNWLARKGQSFCLAFRSNRLKLTLAGLALTMLALCFMQAPYQVSGDCRIEPAVKRFICAPFAAQIERAHVEPGDQVEAGQVLVTLDGRATELELAEIQAELHQATKTRDGFIASHSSGEARLSQLEMDRLIARRDLLLHHKENLAIPSTIQGIVLEGDLKRMEGKPVETGETLFEIAPCKDLVIEVEVPEDDIRHIQHGMETAVRLDAFPFQKYSGRVESIHPSTEIRDDKNVFIVRVALHDAPSTFRPGMEGNARIRTASHSLIWNHGHKAAAQIARWLRW